jgi:hypothetical protein
MQNVAKCLKLKFISHTTYYKIINEYVAPEIHDTWNNERDEYIGTLQENKNYDLRLCGDGQFDSPGHCAKYLCYTIIGSQYQQNCGFCSTSEKNCHW